MSTFVRRVRRGRLIGLVAVLVALVGVAAAYRGVAPASLDGPTDTVAMDPPRFVEEAVPAGIEQAYDGEFRHFVGGGVAAFDCDVRWDDRSVLRGR